MAWEKDKRSGGQTEAGYETVTTHQKKMGNCHNTRTMLYLLSAYLIIQLMVGFAGRLILIGDQCIFQIGIICYNVDLLGIIYGPDNNSYIYVRN